MYSAQEEEIYTLSQELPYMIMEEDIAEVNSQYLEECESVVLASFES